MEQRSTLDILRQTISSWDRGRIFFIDDFAMVESQWGVRYGLSLLAEEGLILRLARGIYCYPRIDGGYSMSAVIPEPEAIAYALAAKDRFRIIPYGDQAAYQLGLTGIRLSDLKYLTDGAPRHVNLAGGRKIFFNHTSEVKQFDFCNGKMQLISSAIRTLGADMIDEERRRTIREHLAEVPESDFLRDIVLPPAWVARIILEIWNR